MAFCRLPIALSFPPSVIKCLTLNATRKHPGIGEAIRTRPDANEHINHMQFMVNVWVDCCSKDAAGQPGNIDTSLNAQSTSVSRKFQQTLRQVNRQQGGEATTIHQE